MSAGDLPAPVARAWRNAALVLAAGTQKVPLDSVTAGDDPGGYFDPTTNHRYNVPSAGVYRVDGLVTAAATVAGGSQYCVAAAYRNGALDCWGGLAWVNNFVANLSSPVATTITCAAGDYLELFVATNAALALVTGKALIMMSVQRVG